MIKLTKNEGKISAETPYNASFVQQVKGIGGKWEKPVWTVSEEKEAELMEILKAVYGYEENNNRKVKVSYDPEYFLADNAVKIGEHITAYRYGRDTAVKLTETIVTGGTLSASGGSVKNPSVLGHNDNLTFTSIIPEYVYNTLSDKEKSHLTIVNSTEEKKQRLEDRKAALLVELEAIEEELKNI